ncbi:MAG TPA: hypothetical protein VLS49_16505 [Usitatibacter sp.]|nr:hypothetical protein [Usitatibacter sp.]
MNPTSGDSLREMMLFARSIVTIVFSRLRPSSGSWNQPSSSASRDHSSKRPSRFTVAPRPFEGAPCLPEVVLRAIAEV